LEVSRVERANWQRSEVPMEQRRPLLLEAINRLYHSRVAHLSPQPEPLRRDDQEVTA
jgi:hypothetical protein